MQIYIYWPKEWNEANSTPSLHMLSASVFALFTGFAFVQFLDVTCGALF